ncbi:MAG: caspase family protein, partial [Saprospiraceae bacterium]|nr:caspase family protein [Saprospiraceae bacterium]
MIGDQASTITKTYTYLLLIGIDAYHTGIPSLHNACRDARTIGELLCAKYQFEPKKTVSLFNDDATGRNILDTLATFEHTLTSQDSLVIYFAGHGFYDTRKEVGYWLPADAQKDNTNSYLSFSVLRDYLKVIPSIHTVILADSCFAGALFMERDITYRQTGLERLAQYPSRYLLAAGRNEPVSDGAVGRHSPFAQSLIDILSYHKEPFLPITQLTLLLIEAVASNAKQLPRGEPLREVGHR